MNSDQMKGDMKDMAGKVERKVGQATNSPEHTIKGAAKQVEGKVQKAAGDVREASKDDDKK